MEEPETGLEGVEERMDSYTAWGSRTKDRMGTAQPEETYTPKIYGISELSEVIILSRTCLTDYNNAQKYLN